MHALLTSFARHAVSKVSIGCARATERGGWGAYDAAGMAGL